MAIDQRLLNSAAWDCPAPIPHDNLVHVVTDRQLDGDHGVPGGRFYCWNALGVVGIADIVVRRVIYLIAHLRWLDGDGNEESSTLCR